MPPIHTAAPAMCRKSASASGTRSSSRAIAWLVVDCPTITSTASAPSASRHPRPEGHANRPGDREARRREHQPGDREIRAEGLGGG